MSRWFRYHSEALDDPKVQKLSGAAFRRKLLAAMDGVVNEFTPFLKRYVERPLPIKWAETRKRIFERDNYTCGYCFARGGRLECDHVIAVSRGGSNDDENLLTACFKCNRSKRAKTVAEWRQ